MTDATTAATTTLRSDAKVLGLIGTAHFISHVYQIALPPLFILLRHEFDVSYAALGAVVTVFMGANGLSQVPVGFLVDRIGARSVLVGGLVLESTAIGLVALAPSYPWVLALALAAGLGHSAFHPANYAILSSSVDEARMGRAFSLHTFSGFLGTAVAPVAIIFMATLWSWRAALLVLMATGIAIAFALVASGNVLRDDVVPRDKAKADSGASLANGARFLLSLPMIMFFLFFTTTGVIHSGIHSFSVVALVAMYDAPLTAAGAALTGFLFAVAGGILVGGVVADRTRHHNLVAAVAFAVTAAAIAVVGAVPLAMTSIVALFALAGLCQGMVMPARDMMVRAVSPKGASGKAFGFMAAGGSVGGVVTPPLFGWVVDQGRPQWVFWVVAAVMIVSIATVLPAKRRPAT